jgi:hypothetical protein
MKKFLKSKDDWYYRTRLSVSKLFLDEILANLLWQEIDFASVFSLAILSNSCTFRWTFLRRSTWRKIAETWLNTSKESSNNSGRTGSNNVRLVAWSVTRDKSHKLDFLLFMKLINKCSHIKRLIAVEGSILNGMCF